ncbi:MAG: aminoglycoside 3'-phosphotransferase [Clostridia bacterium]|nr:aminoglycoside 3'-phosphotransferase [Clostridia bacterium]
MTLRPLSLGLPKDAPEGILRFLSGALVYDSSCSPEARVYFIDKDGGYFLKTAKKGSLEAEAKMTAYFHQKGIGAEVLAYESDTADWFLTAKVQGKDCTDERYLSSPARLCDTLAAELRKLHELDFCDCPVSDRMQGYFDTVNANYKAKQYDLSFAKYATAEDAFAAFERGKGLLKDKVLLHGDYCLPNVILDDWKLSAFIDVGNGGVGDRHIDLFWGAWTLWFNLKTNAYRRRFLDAYGRDKVNEDAIAAIAAAEVFG